MKIDNIQPQLTQTFQGRGGHLPKTFEGMMNKIYSKTVSRSIDTFENTDMVKLSVPLDNGDIASGTAHFWNGRYTGLTVDEGVSINKNEFIKLLLKRYKLSIARDKIKNKLGY